MRALRFRGGAEFEIEESANRDRVEILTRGKRLRVCDRKELSWEVPGDTGYSSRSEVVWDRELELGAKRERN